MRFRSDIYEKEFPRSLQKTENPFTESAVESDDVIEETETTEESEVDESE